MFSLSLRNPTIDYGSFYEDKYHKIGNKRVFKLLILIILCHPSCQICLPKFFTKKHQNSARNEIFRVEVFPQILSNYISLALYSRNLKSKINDKFKLKNSNNNYFQTGFDVKKLNISNLFFFSKLLRSGDIKPNPGPEGTQGTHLTINTYNARGLKSRPKLKRVLNTCHKLINENRNSLIFLQETHLDDSDKTSLDIMWRYNYLMSPGTNRQCGCLILYDSSWEVVEQDIDNEGRFCLASLKKFNTIFSFANIYAPNNHDLNFFAQVFNRLIDSQTAHPDSSLILAGDFNFVLDEIDAVNRNNTPTEIQCRTQFTRNINRLDLQDSYRIKQKEGGYTWYRGNCMSRLDMIFVSKDLSKELISSRVDWAFDDSDHAMVQSKFKICETFKKGPGLIRIDTDILDCETSLSQIKLELDLHINQIPEHWNPHFKLDFIKTALRSIIGVAAGKKRKLDNLDQQATAEQLNTLLMVKAKLERGEIVNPQLLIDTNHVIGVLEAEHQKFLDDTAKKLSIRAQSKWYEEGERSNKYFLNIIKKRSQQTLITRLETSEGSLTTQNEIMSHVTEFYTQLYDNKETDDNFDELLSECPSLGPEDRAMLDKEITLDELQRVVNRCGDSSPGPDGLPYKVYRKLWDQLGSFLLDAWKYSFIIGYLPRDQRLSAITLLPKLGKDLDKIENWRPITLTNCDLKIFTKLISDRVSKVLDKIIHPCQTAYIPGRVVHDNLRIFEFYNNYCKEKNIDALLLSLDAKKAFDSVSHKYMHKVLEAYGFSNEFIETVKLLYRDIKAQILVNGYKSVIIKILRSVKQGDALSCALFILCIDPLIRKIDTNPDISPVPIPRSRFTDITITSKISGFADDIGLAVNNDKKTIDSIFKDYSTFSKLSGIELNVDKTEILKLNHNSTHQDFASYPIQVKNTIIYTKEAIKICGIHFSSSLTLAYERNILDKITSMEKQLIMWLQRPLSLEGKNLIVKTFGLSQLIYSLQMCDIYERELIDIERMIFKFLWNKRWVGSIAPDRIKRDTLKMTFEKGGLQVPDIKFLNKALKVKQFIRSMKTRHPINFIQKFQLERTGYFEYYKCEYAKICKTDPVVATYQETCKLLTDKMRNPCNMLPIPEPSTIQDSINVVASTDILEYLKIKNFPLIIARYSRLANLGISSFYQLVNESRFPRSDSIGDLANYILKFFPIPWVTSVLSADDLNQDITYEAEFPSTNLTLCHSEQITVKLIRKTLVETINVAPYPYLNHEKFQLDNVEHNEPFVLLRKAIHTPRDRFFKYRILQGDIFCNERMYRFKMINSPHCTYCERNAEIETIKHLLWDCPRSQNVWNNLNNIIIRSHNLNYLTYNAVVLGATNPIPLIERLILCALKLILTKDRTNVITNEALISKIKLQYILERNYMRKKRSTFEKQWAGLNAIISFHQV